ncbi:MAG TPA: hypothetical protein VGF45_06760, partial [Polyangia bacterium]
EDERGRRRDGLTGIAFDLALAPRSVEGRGQLNDPPAVINAMHPGVGGQFPCTATSRLAEQPVDLLPDGGGRGTSCRGLPLEAQPVAGRPGISLAQGGTRPGHADSEKSGEGRELCST